jgi:GTPase SAR1 family protein
VIVVGDAAVGKTSLVNRFVKDSFSEVYLDTISVDISKTEGESLDGRPLKCNRQPT